MEPVSRYYVERDSLTSSGFFVSAFFIETASWTEHIVD